MDTSKNSCKVICRISKSNINIIISSGWKVITNDKQSTYPHKNERASFLLSISLEDFLGILLHFRSIIRHKKFRFRIIHHFSQLRVSNRSGIFIGGWDKARWSRALNRDFHHSYPFSWMVWVTLSLPVLSRLHKKWLLIDSLVSILSIKPFTAYTLFVA